MVFSTIIFLCAFLPIVIIGYYLLPAKAKNIWLLLCSIFFYAWGEPKFVWIMLGSILANYIFGRLLDRSQGEKRSRLILAAAVFVNLGILFVFKYFTFVMETIQKITLGSFNVIQIALPIGISFYTFQGLSYVIDVYRVKKEQEESGGRKKGNVSQHSFIQLALYIAMFPQLIAGPIVRYHDIEPYLAERKHSVEKFASGVERFIIGLSKKAILANVIGRMAADIMEGDVSMLDFSVAWLGAVSYTLQIYFDFSGYSDMAIGLGRIFGFEFMENFNYPYISRSIKEFWRRWHISLSGWFRDYLYIPLGGSRRGSAVFHLLLVFFATGIWHGAAWGFVVWGLYHGFFRLLEYYVEKWSEKKKKAHCDIPPACLFLSNFAKWIYTTLVVIIGWVIFAKVDILEALRYIAVMFGLKQNGYTAYDMRYYLSNQLIFFLIAAVLACIPWRQVMNGLAGRKGACPKEGGGIQAICILCVKRLLLLGLLMLSFVFIINSSYNPFIYFRF